MATKLPTSRKALNKLAKENGIDKPQFISLSKLKKQVAEVLKSSGGGKKATKKRGPGRPPGSGKKKAAPATKVTGKKRGRPPGSGKKAAPKKGVPGAKKRGPGRPPGSGKKAAVKAPAKRGPGRPPGSGTKKRGPGRPPKSETAAKIKKTTPSKKSQVVDEDEFNLASVERAVKNTARRMKGIDEFATMFSEEFPEMGKALKQLVRDVKWLRKNFEEIIAGSEEEEPAEEETAEEPEEEQQEEETPDPPKKKKKKKKKKSAPAKEEVDHTGDNDGSTEESSEEEDVVELDVDKIQSAKLPELYKMGDSVEYGDEMRKLKKEGKNVKYIRVAFLTYLKENASLD